VRVACSTNSGVGGKYHLVGRGMEVPGAGGEGIGRRGSVLVDLIRSHTGRCLYDEMEIQRGKKRGAIRVGSQLGRSLNKKSGVQKERLRDGRGKESLCPEDLKKRVRRECVTLDEGRIQPSYKRQVNQEKRPARKRRGL